MAGNTVGLGRMLKERVDDENMVQALVELEGLNHRRARWILSQPGHLPDFPLCNVEYVNELTIGVYQAQLAPAYIQDELYRNSSTVFQYNTFPEPGFLRMRLFSRFRNATQYSLWIVLC